MQMQSCSSQITFELNAPRVGTKAFLKGVKLGISQLEQYLPVLIIHHQIN